MGLPAESLYTAFETSAKCKTFSSKVGNLDKWCHAGGIRTDPGAHVYPRNVLKVSIMSWREQGLYWTFPFLASGPQEGTQGREMRS